jgi:hypothetical protein
MGADIHDALEQTLLESRNVAFGFLAPDTDLQEELTFIDALQRIKLSVSTVTSRFIVQATEGYITTAEV